MRADGSGLRQLTQNESFDAMTTWAPDGRRLAYECRKGDEPHICNIDLKGAAPRIITTLQEPGQPGPICPSGQAGR